MRRTRICQLFAFFFVSSAAFTGGACGDGRVASSSHKVTAPDATPMRGGSIVGSVRSDPTSFNRLLFADRSTELVSILTQAKLVRVNRVTQHVEPWLAESWTANANGRCVTLKLRAGVVFSDGEPFTADDVVFTLAAAYDKSTDSVLAEALTVGGRPIEARAVDPRTVTLTFATPYAPGVRILDNLPILPKHKLDAALHAGTLRKQWTPGMPPVELAGLGPFVLREYAPGQRLVFERNPHYWRKGPGGVNLPYLDRISIEVIPDQNAEMLRLDAGELDVMNEDLTPEAYGWMKKASRDGRVRLIDVGTAQQADSFWLNLKPGAYAGDPRAPWLQRDELRRAISLAVNRQAFVDEVFLGAGKPVYGPVSPANEMWFWSDTPKTPYDPNQAKALLTSAGVPPGARFSILVQKGRPRLERGAAFIRDELRKIGLTVDVIALEGNTVVQRILSGKYDAVYFAPTVTDTDPAN